MNNSFPDAPAVKTAITTLNEAGYEAWLVGGCVRDFLLGRPVHDYDLTTDATPEQMKTVFKDRRVLNTGLKHGTLTIFVDHVPIEITTYRTETHYMDHRHPDAVHFTRSLKEDCARRDFTINAMCLHPTLGLRDFFHGQQDLSDHILRTVNDPDLRFDEDSLRILRALRFAATFGFTLEKNTKEAILRRIQDLSYVSQERIYSELTRMFKGKYAYEVLADRTDLFAFLFPCFASLSPTRQNEAAQLLKNAKNDADLSTALLLHDCPLQEVQRDLRHLTYPNASIDKVTQLIQLQNRTAEDPIALKWLLHDLAERPLEDWLNFEYALGKNTRKVEELNSAWQKAPTPLFLKDLSINGKDLLQLGLKGKEIRIMLDTILKEVLEERLPNEKDVLLSYVRMHRNAK